MDIGIGSYTFPWHIGVGEDHPATPLTPMRLLEKAVSLNVSLVQICDNMPLADMTEDALSQLALCAQNSGLRIEVGTRGIAPEHLRTYLQLAVFFHSPILRIVTDTAESHPDMHEIVARLSSVMADFEGAGVVLALENHDRFTADEFVNIMTCVGSPNIGMCLDTVNSFGALEGPQVVVQTLAPWVRCLHVKDFAITRASHQLGFLIEGRPAGQGRLNLPWVMRELRAAGQTPAAVLELWTPPDASLEATIEKEARWARESIAYLQNLSIDIT